MTHTFETCIYRDDDEIAVRVTYQVTPYYPATHLQPAEGGNCEIISAVIINADAATMPAPLDDGEYDTLQVICEGRARDDEADAAADYADYLYEQHKDRRMMDAWEAVQ